MGRPFTTGEPRRAHVVVDLAAVGENDRKVSRYVLPARVGPVLKADACGLGAAPVARRLYRAGCRDFFVAVFDEVLIRLGQRLRRIYINDDEALA